MFDKNQNKSFRSMNLPKDEIADYVIILFNFSTNYIKELMMAKTL